MLRRCVIKTADGGRSADESITKTRRVSIVPRSNRVDMEQVMNHLRSPPPIWKSYRINLEHDRSGWSSGGEKPAGDPTEGWRSAATRCRRSEIHRLKVLKRSHILEGLLVAFSTSTK
ncbi:hypothetical protein KCP76_05900 [Salmonella enterica subsp. enterica serovar Weltevreden]|nr:hypothetical protein KCP76_05900 [Salmonella enterica subsp. enterica serovar Weltevreden]